MDIINFISNEGYASLLSKLLMKPYQLKMTSHLNITPQSIPNSNKDLTMQSAIEMLLDKKISNQASQMEDKINTTLLKSV